MFRNVRIDYEPAAGADPSLQRLIVRVEEEQPLTLTLGAGYDNEGSFRGSFALVHHNLGGRDRTLGLVGRLSGIEQRAQLTATEPRLFGHHTPTLLNLLWEFREAVGFSEKRRAASVRADKRLSDRWSALARYRLQRVDLSEVTDPIRLQEEKLEDIQLGDAGVAAIHDTRDDPFRTRRGSYSIIDLRVFAKPLLSESSFVKASLQSSYTATFHERHTWASALRIGLADPFGESTRVPISERFFAGGDATIRGFPRDAVGPSVDGVPTGGESMLIINQEWRFPIWRRLRGVLFYDAGNVYETLGDLDPLDLRHVLGVGVRLETPIGPLRVEYGRKLDRRPAESAGELFFAIGNAF